MTKTIFAKTLSILIATALLLALLPTGIIAFAEIVDSGTCGDNLTWTLDNAGNLIISGTGDMWDYDYSEYPIPTSPWVDSRFGIKTVTINNGVTSIGKCAFALHSPSSVTMADTVTSIGDRAFDWGSFDSIRLSNNLERIGAGAFASCSINMDTLELPDSLKYIGGGAFYFCDYYLKKVYIPDSVNYIGDHGFYPCFDGFTLYVFKNSYAHLWARNNDVLFEIVEESGKCGENVYWSLDGSTLNIVGTGDMYDDYTPAWPNFIKEVVIGDGVTSIGDSAFEGCDGLTNVTMGNGVTSIGRSAFYGCTNLTSVTIPDGVTSIYEFAFQGCTALMNVTIPDSVTSVRGYAFYNTGYYNDESNWENGVLYIGKWLVEAKSDISGAYSVKDGTAGIVGAAFADCRGLTSVTLPDSIVNIGGWAFSGCTGLASITIPESVASMGDGVFEYYDDNAGSYKQNSILKVYENSYALEYAISYSLEYEIIKKPTVTKGDPDGDGKITVGDALSALRVAARIVEATPELIATCDIDGDGKVTVGDALSILRVAARIVASF